jgi:malonate decarboxylase beta subunit
VSAAPTLAEAIRDTLEVEAQGAAAGNVTVGRGVLDGKTVRVAMIENRFASGSLGRVEAERLVALLRIVASERAALVVCLDSAGAKVSEGLAALGAFRVLYRAGLEAVLAGAPMAMALGRNCYGGASMLAHLAPQRLFSPNTQLAMSGPAILAAAAGTSPTDEVFRAMAQAALAPAARVEASPANRLWSPGMDLRAWLRQALAPGGDATTAFRFRHQALAARIERRPPDAPWEPVRRRDLERIYGGRFEARDSHGLLEGEGHRGEDAESFVGIVGNAPLGVARAWRFADAVWRHGERPPRRLEVYLDCASHAPRLEDERAVLTEFIVDMSFALASLAARGTRVGLTVLGKAGGGVYVALAAPAQRVASVHGAEIQVLPGSAVAAILGEGHDSVPSFDDYRAAGVADEEIKLGLLPE